MKSTAASVTVNQTLTSLSCKLVIYFSQQSREFIRLTDTIQLSLTSFTSKFKDGKKKIILH